MDTIERAADTSSGAFVLRPGVLMPEWSFVTDPTAREALDASMTTAQRAGKWSGLGALEDGVWQAVLREFALSGRAPDAPQLAAATGLAEPVVVPTLRALHRRDLLVLDGEGGAIRVTAAYPFCAWETGHRVQLGSTGTTVGCLCAIDALGAGAMLGCDTTIQSSCRGCGQPIRIVTRGAGHVLHSVTPTTAVVWSGNRYAGGCCATSGCTVKLFFCSDEHLLAWRERCDPSDTGFRLSMAAALQVGKALFVPMLAAGPATHASSGR